MDLSKYPSPAFVLLQVALMLFIGSCAVNPVTGERELAVYSQAWELSTGSRQFDPSQQMQGGRYSIDPALAEYVSEVGNRLAAVSDRALPYEFVVLNSSVPNAWALPGGKIAVNRGLLTELNNEAELAAVLSHEIVHAAARHGAKSMQRGMFLQGAILLTALSTRDHEYNNYIVGAGQLGAQLLNQKHGRDAEREADYYGIRYMARAGYDLQAAISLQETFVKLSEDRKSNWFDGLFSGHPPSQERVDRNRATVAALGAPVGDKGAERFFSAISSLTRRKPAYDAYDDAKKLASEGKFEAALATSERAIDLEPREASFYGLKGDITLRQKNYAEAQRWFTDAIQREPAYFQYYLGRGLAKSRRGLRAEAKADLQRSNELLPTALAMNELGKISLARGNRISAKKFFKTAASASGELGREARSAFIGLDITDNPGAYVKAEPRLAHDGSIAAIVTNATHLTLRNIITEFSVIIDGETIRRQRLVYVLKPGEAVQVGSGWHFTEAANVTHIRSNVVRVEVAPSAYP